MVFRCPNIQAHYNEAVLCLNFGTPENNEFSIWDKWKIYYFWVSQYLSTLGYFCMKSLQVVSICMAMKILTLPLALLDLWPVKMRYN